MPPPEFNLDVWLRTLDRLEAQGFARIYPTHFGPCNEPKTHYANVREDLHVQSGYLAKLIEAGLDDEAIYNRYKLWLLERAREQRLPANRFSFYVSESVTRMNITGMRRYMARDMAREPQAQGSRVEAGAPVRASCAE
jgi:hypothetical protein